MIISSATKKNWERLNIEADKKGLNKRANKKLSKKLIFPIECVANRDNIALLEEIVDEILSSNNQIADCLFSLAVNYLKLNQLFDDVCNIQNQYIKDFVNQNAYKIDNQLLEINLPPDEPDILGLIYQATKLEGAKNQEGSYYTPMNVCQQILDGVCLDYDDSFLDPCCGSGSFLTAIETKNPNNIFGFDIDPIATMIATANLFVKYKEMEFKPNIINLDFMSDLLIQSDRIPNKFDCIATNPPWGAFAQNSTLNMLEGVKESFSHFLVKSATLLNENGKLIFLLPESFLNVKAHEKTRRYMLSRYSLDHINYFPNIFSGVTTAFSSVSFLNSPTKISNFTYHKGTKNTQMEIQPILDDKNCIISFQNDNDRKIIKNVYSREYQTLENSCWALGIVTGDNKSMLLKQSDTNLEPIFTGKEIQPYGLLPSSNFIEYKREKFQQVAPEETYRAPEKLIYKFISKKLVFAYDNQRNLFLNSANILIPKIESMDIKSVMAFLNSPLFQFLYMKKFGEIKILKGNLAQLPFPRITPEFDQMLISHVNNILSGDISSRKIIDNEIFNFFEISDDEKMYIMEEIDGRII